MDDREKIVRQLKPRIMHDGVVEQWNGFASELEATASKIRSMIERTMTDGPVDPIAVMTVLIDKAIEYEGQIAALKAENEDQKAMIAKLTAEIEPLKPVAAE
jgi:hypothetical protein